MDVLALVHAVVALKFVGPLVVSNREAEGILVNEVAATERPPAEEALSVTVMVVPLASPEAA